MFKSTKKYVIIFSVFMCIMSLCGCSQNQRREESMQMNDFFFDTVVRIEVWGNANRDLMEECKEICRKYEQLFDRRNEKSDIWKINHSQGKQVEVSEETARLIKKTLEYSARSKGAFDITIAPLSDLWDVKNNPGTIPLQEEIDKAKTHIDYQKIQVEGNFITLQDPEMAIDLGAVAKGYIADQLKEFLEQNGVKHGVIDLGGNVLTIGDKINGEPFHIGLQKPFANRGEILTSVKVTDQSVVSSGIYERFFEKNHKIYHHIMNPETGYPYENDLLQVTIISDTSLEGDAFSTMCYALGLEQGKKLVEEQENMRALFVTKDYKIHKVGF